MLSMAEIWRLLSGQAEWEATQRNLKAHEKAQECYGLEGHLDEIDELMHHDRGVETNGSHRTTRKRNNRSK